MISFILLPFTILSISDSTPINHYNLPSTEYVGELTEANIYIRFINLTYNSPQSAYINIELYDETDTKIFTEDGTLNRTMSSVDNSSIQTFMSDTADLRFRLPQAYYINVECEAPISYYVGFEIIIEGEAVYDADISKAYNEGYSDGYNDGINDGYINGYNDGEVKGFDNGVIDGYNRGLIAGQSSATGFDWLRNAFYTINDLLSIEILPNIKLSYLIGIPLIIMIVSFVLGWFR